jgi:hypothetical protein
MNMVIGKPAPDEDKNCCNNNRADNRHPIEKWLTGNMKMQETNNYDNSKESYNNGSDDAIGRTPPCQKFPDKANG